MKRIELTGKRVGRLTVLEFMPYEDNHKGRKRRKYRCKCDCGNETIIVSDSLLSKTPTLSCGCLHNESTAKINYSHGMSYTKEHKTWCGIKGRCNNKSNLKYPIYGARGIKVCERWENDFMEFYADMGCAPTALHSIDRIDVNGDYEPLNCRWATPKQQANNTRQNRVVAVNGISKTAKQWSEYLNVEYKYFWRVLKNNDYNLKNTIEWLNIKNRIELPTDLKVGMLM